jgi:hypothetical protein
VFGVYVVLPATDIRMMKAKGDGMSGSHGSMNDRENKCIQSFGKKTRRK